MNIRPYLELMRLNRPVGIYLLLWPTLTALVIAGDGMPSIKNLLIFILGVVLSRSAGCVINDYADRNFDRHVSRTKDRPITSGRIDKNHALALFFALITLCLILVLQTNTLTIALAVPAVVLMIVYPFIKRISNAPQFILGLAFAASIPMAFAAEVNVVPIAAIWLVLATVFWAVVYDTIYAMVDMDDDLKIKVKSTAILFGKNVRIWIGVFQVLMVFCLIMAGLDFELDWPYYLGLVIGVAMLIYHQTLIRGKDKSDYFTAFLHNHRLGLTVLLFTVLSYL